MNLPLDVYYAIGWSMHYRYILIVYIYRSIIRIGKSQEKSLQFNPLIACLKVLYLYLKKNINCGLKKAITIGHILHYIKYYILTRYKNVLEPRDSRNNNK